MKKFLLVFVLILSQYVYAIEGMWLPLMLKELNESEMKTMGFRLSADDIYNVNKACMKDAVLIFGRGCTGEIISNQGLLLTNHHCGEGQIQSHSSLEKDYLKNGFWAKNRSEELPNKGLTVTRIVRMENVTDKVLINGIATEQSVIDANIKKINEQAVLGTHYVASTRSFYYGNEYYLFVTEVFKDVRLVGAPPSSMGAYGKDTDNWMWPRHSADFSLFRIYVDKNGKPAEYSESNVPYKPLYHFPISMKGVKANDFTMVYGFPGRTQEYLHSDAVDLVANHTNPIRIKMRTACLKAMNGEMEKDALIKIQYSDKASGIANGWKKWQGESNGINKADAVSKKKDFEANLIRLAKDNGATEKIIKDLATAYAEYKPAVINFEYYNEFLTDGSELFSIASDLIEPYEKYKLLSTQDTATQRKFKKEIHASLDKFSSQLDGIYKDFNLMVDQKLFTAVTPIFLKDMEGKLPPLLNTYWIKSKKNIDVLRTMIYGKTMFGEKEKIASWITATKKDLKKGFAALEKDNMFMLSRDIFTVFETVYQPPVQASTTKISDLMKKYMKSILTYGTTLKRLYPDANSTLRVTYGKVETYMQQDGAEYKYYTTIDGVMEKYKPGDYEYDLLPRYVELYNKKDWGPYAENGVLKTCFIASNHTTGGNSGSPVINADGHLIGINFDRAWESTMSDIIYNPDKCRNVACDIRYVLWTIDKFGDCKYLVDEMTLVK